MSTKIVMILYKSHFTTNEKHIFFYKKNPNFVIHVEQIYFHYRLNIYYLIPFFSTIALIRFKVEGNCSAKTRPKCLSRGIQMKPQIAYDILSIPY